MVLNGEDRFAILVKSLYYQTWTLMNEFPAKTWKKISLTSFKG